MHDPRLDHFSQADTALVDSYQQALGYETEEIPSWNIGICVHRGVRGCGDQNFWDQREGDSSSHLKIF